MLIAEIGNCHFGSKERAKELIRASHEAGADLIKGQAFVAADLKHGSMPESFYEACAFTMNDYLELIDYARSIGSDLFYSIFSMPFMALHKYQRWHKEAGFTVRNRAQHTMLPMLQALDTENQIVSVPKDVDFFKLPKLHHAELLYVSDYLPEDPELENIRTLSQIHGRQVGYSDHTLGIDACVRAAEEFGAHIIEKHVCLVNAESWEGTVFRDTLHGITPAELEKLAKRLEG